jgi:hypothetical protein
VHITSPDSGSVTVRPVPQLEHTSEGEEEESILAAAMTVWNCDLVYSFNFLIFLSDSETMTISQELYYSNYI